MRVEMNCGDVRFKASGRETAQAWQVHFPVHLRISRPATMPALHDAARVVDQLRQTVDQAELPNARLVVLDFDSDDAAAVTGFTIEQKSPREMRLLLTLTVALTLEGTDGFWARAAAIGAAGDLLQGFALRPHDKAVEVVLHQGRLINKQTGAEAGLGAWGPGGRAS